MGPNAISSRVLAPITITAGSHRSSPDSNFSRDDPPPTLESASRERAHVSSISFGRRIRLQAACEGKGSADGLDPAEAFFDPFADELAERIALAAVDCRDAPACIFRHKRRHPHRAQLVHKTLAINFIGAKRPRSPARRANRSLKRGDAIGVSVRLREPSVDEESVAVLDHRLADYAQLHLFA